LVFFSTELDVTDLYGENDLPWIGLGKLFSKIHLLFYSVILKFQPIILSSQPIILPLFSNSTMEYKFCTQARLICSRNLSDDLYSPRVKLKVIIGASKGF